MAALRRAGVSQDIIDDVYTASLQYNDELLFRNLSRFFRRDIETLKVWIKANSPSKAFEKLFNIYNKNNLATAKQKLSELALIFEFYKKGEGQIFTGKCRSRLLPKNFTTTNLRRKLTYAGGNADYIEKGNANFGKERIIWLQKNTDGRKTDKFIKISRERNNLYVSLSFDSKKEYYIAKNELEKRFDVYLETPELEVDFKKLFNFLKTGVSNHFILSGSTFLDDEFRVSIVPSHNKISNVATLNAYKNKIIADSKRLEYLTRIRLSYLNKTITKPIFVSILTYREGIFGAILLRPDDKKLTTVQRRSLNADFQTDFGTPLNTFLEFKDLDEQTIYRYYLQTTPSKSLKIEARSEKALSIYRDLVADNLLDPDDTSEEIAKVCVNSACREYFKPSWDNKKYCPVCSEILINGKSIEIKKIEEKNIVLFLKKVFTEGDVSITSKKLLSKPIFVAQVIYKNEVSDFIPINKELSDNQIEVLKFRFPHAVIITTRDNKDTLISKGLRAISLWELVYSFKHDSARLIKRLTISSRANSLANMRVLCGTSVKRIVETEYYKERNREVKNLGAELFEAESSILLDYIFGNSLWLGAKYRGTSVPDGFTAFPMLESKKGCFIWDGKFSEGKTLVMGQFAKNRRYIDEAKSNKSIKENGGLKGFLFISNNIFPASFLKKYKPLTKNRKIKIAFIRAGQLQKIVEHYMSHEALILNNSKARNQFINSMMYLFFNTSKNRKCEIIADATIEQLTLENETIFNSLKAGRPLTV